MPNIIQQQDLLKGLPDDRLALLMQQPTGDIPPFLVAAEAQRRQAIRQQFAGASNNESVVDTLTKQISSVPQNLRTAPQTPPVVPPTPEMAGVAALQQQQAMEQAAQNAVQQQPQMMRAGGPVRRYAPGGYVPAVVPAVSGRVKQIADQFDVTVEQAAEMLKNNPSLAGKDDIFGSPDTDFGKPFDIKEDNQEPRAEPLFRATPPDEYFRERKYNEMDSYGGYAPKAAIGVKGMSAEEIDRENQRLLQRLSMKEGQSVEPLDGDPPPEDGETEDEYRARLEELMAAREPSDWEKAQRWFAMSEQFLDPSKTTMQSVAGAGRAFSEQSAAMAAAQQQAEIEAKKAMLLYDREEANRKRSEAASAADMRRGAYKFYAEDARDNIRAINEDTRQLVRERKEYLDSLPKEMDTEQPIIPPGDARLAELDEQIAENRRLINDLIARQTAAIRNYGEMTGTDPSVEIYTGTGLRRVGGK